MLVLVDQCTSPRHSLIQISNTTIDIPVKTARDLGQQLEYHAITRLNANCFYHAILDQVRSRHEMRRGASAAGGRLTAFAAARGGTATAAGAARKGVAGPARALR